MTVGWPAELWVQVDDDGVSEIAWGDDDVPVLARCYVPALVEGQRGELAQIADAVEDGAPVDVSLDRRMKAATLLRSLAPTEPSYGGEGNA